MADKVVFQLPANYGEIDLAALTWSIRAASEKNTLVTAVLTSSASDGCCLVTWEVSADFTAVSGALSLMLVGTDSGGNIVIKFPGDDPIWVRDSETGMYSPPPDVIENALAALEQAQEQLTEATETIQQLGVNFKILGYYDTLEALEIGVPNPGAGDAYGVGNPAQVYIWDGTQWTNLPGILVSPPLPLSIANGGTGGETAGEARANLGAAGNKNLLMNWDFRNPVNQRGKTSYTGNNQYTVDMWKLSGSASMELQDSGIALTIPFAEAGTWSNSVMQVLEMDASQLVGRTATVSILVSSASANVGCRIRLVDSSDVFVGHIFLSSLQNGLNSVSGEIPENTKTIQFQIGNTSTTESGNVTVQAVKLEIGSVSTLASQNEEGSWVLNDPPQDYAEELRKCQRYQFMTNASSRWARASKITDSVIYFDAACPAAMRANPTITQNNTLRVATFDAASTAQAGFTFACTGQQGAIRIAASKANHGLTDATLEMVRVLFDANL